MSKRAIIGTIAVSVVVLTAVLVATLGARSRRSATEEAPAPGVEPAAAAPPRALPAPSVPPPRPPPPAVAATPPARSAASPGAGPLENEAALMVKLRDLEGVDSPLTLRLAREANAKAPDSPDAPERAWMIVKSLTNLQRFQEARDEAQTMVNRYPGTSWSLDVQRHLLSNPLE